MAVIPEQSLDILESKAFASMATLGPNGEPQVSVVWFVWDGTNLLFAFSKKRQKYRNLVRDPRVAVALADPNNPYRALEIRGKVTRIERDTDLKYANMAAQKYSGRDSTPEEIGALEDRVVIVVEPESAIPFPR